MSKVFACDRCKDEFGGPLDEIQYKSGDGVLRTYDLCAPCRKELKDNLEKAEKDFFDTIK